MGEVAPKYDFNIPELHKFKSSKNNSGKWNIFVFIAAIFLAIAIPMIYFSLADEPDNTVLPNDGIDWNNAPCSPYELSDEWVDVTHPIRKIKSNRRDFLHKTTGLKIAFDRAVKGASGYKGKNHWHRYNPNSTNNSDYYLDEDGNSIKKNDENSHITPDC